uniref:Heparanase n=1 Tax=Anopheles arabiensis TaxID=7173 RepID=A0A182HZ52_ANOAR
MTVVQSKVKLFARLWLVVVILLLVPGVRGVDGDNEVPPAAAAPESVRQLGVSVNTRRLANVLGDEFISFSAKPQDIFDGQGNPITETSFLMAQSLGGTFLKVIADSSQLHMQTTGGQSVIGNPDDVELVQISASAWQAFYDWARRANILPVFVLDYPTDGGQWDVKKALRILTAASALGIDECRWQLGNGLVKDGVKYADDLRTFRTMLQAFPKQNWTVVASELNPQLVPLEDVQYFHANGDSLVDAITISRPRYDSAAWNYTTLQRDIHLRGLSKQRLPIWLDLVADYNRSEVEASADTESTAAPTCCKSCVQEGLDYARTLGEAARGGISAVFQPLQRDDIQQYSLHYLISALYKQTVGHKVFPVHFNLLPAGEEPGQTSVYAYCTRNRTGSLTLVLVNGEEEGATNATIKLLTRSLSSPVELFLLSVQDGQPMVNNLPLDATATTTPPSIEPVKAVTTLTHGVSFYVPAQTILFAVIPGVQVRECRNDALPERKKLPRELQHDRTSTDLLLEELIGELLANVPRDTLQRRRRSLGEQDKPTIKANKKWKRFHARFTDASQSDGLAESLSAVLADAQSTVGPTERTARGPRQTQAYKRQQRRIRNKEKRSEMRNLKKMKHPLREARRERSKRGDLLKARRSAAHPHRRIHQRLLNRMSAKLESRKTKRSSLAEAVNEPPNFGAGSDEQDELGQRSDFPLGDVHLVISKGGNGDGEVEYVPTDDDDDDDDGVEVGMVERKQSWSGARHRPAIRRRISVNQRDFYRFAPVWDRSRTLEGGQEQSDCGRRRTLRRGPKDPEARETKRIDRFMSIGKERSEEVNAMEAKSGQPETASTREEFTIAKKEEVRLDSEEGQRQQEPVQEKSQEEPTIVSGENHDQVTDRTTMPPSEEEIHLYTPAPRTSEEQQSVPQLDPIWSLESSPESSAEVSELMHNRYKRSLQPSAEASVESQEVQRLEDFFRTNAKLQQKFAEMFDLLLEAIEELDAEENDAREVSDDGEAEHDGDEVAERAGTGMPSHKRSKRNVLLHPQSWESRERSNMIHRRERSEEDSYENHIIAAAQPKAPSKSLAEHAGGVQTSQESQQPEHEQDSDEGKPGAFMLRSVVNFMRRASTEFHQLFSSWFGKTA